MPMSGWEVLYLLETRAPAPASSLQDKDSTMKWIAAALLACTGLFAHSAYSQAQEVQCNGTGMKVMDGSQTGWGLGGSVVGAVRDAIKDLRDASFFCTHCDKSGCNIQGLTVQDSSGNPVDLGPDDNNGEYDGSIWNIGPNGNPNDGIYNAALTLPAGYTIHTACTECVDPAEPE